MVDSYYSTFKSYSEASTFSHDLACVLAQTPDSSLQFKHIIIQGLRFVGNPKT